MPGAAWPVVGLRPGFLRNFAGHFAASCFLLPMAEWDSLASILQTRWTLPTGAFLRRAKTVGQYRRDLSVEVRDSIDDLMLTRFIL